jgi:hypothetical protein
MKIGRSADVSEILKINPKFEQIIPPLSAEEFAQLEENILKVGRVIEPIQVWRGFIVDGHHRYKIVQKHPEITYKIEELKYECEGEVFAWICNLQLGRRNITENQKRYLVGKRYDSELVILDFYGNQHTLPKKSGLGTSCPDQKGHGTRTIIAEQNGVSDGYVNKAYQYMKGVNAAEEVCPGIKDEILTGVIETSIPEIVGLEKIPFINEYFVYNLKNYLFVLIISIFSATPIFSCLNKKIANNNNIIIDGFEILYLLGILFISTAFLVDSSFNPFLYFRF